MRDWDDHRLILTLHRCGTLRATGDALGVTHTTVARRLAALNSAETTPLFTRMERAYVATPYGLERVALAERMERLDDAASRLQRRSDQGLSGPLSLSVPQAVFRHLLRETIRDFVAAHPAIDLRVVGTDRLADLDRGEADVVIRGHVSPPDHLVGRRICTVAVGHYAHEAYLRRTSERDRGWIAREWQPDWIAGSPYPDSPVTAVFDDIQSSFLALESGYGMARTACFLADPHPGLVRIDDGRAIPIYGLWVLTHPDLRKAPKIQTLMSALANALSESRPLIEGRRG